MNFKNLFVDRKAMGIKMQDICVYEKDNIYTAFLAGAAGAVLELFEIMIPASAWMQGNYIETDVFYLGENNEITIEEALKTRFRNFWYVETNLTEKEQKAMIDDFTLKLEKVDESFEQLVHSVVLSLMEPAKRDTIDNYANLIQQYCDEITDCFGHIKSIYHQDRSENPYDLLYANFGPLIWDVFFIEFDEQVLMLMPANSE